MPDQTDAVRARAQVVCEALVAGDVERVIDEMSEELKRNLGEVMAILPLPAVEVNVGSIERAGSAHVVVFEVVGETDQSQVQTRWKDRDGTHKIVEVSNLSRTERAQPGEPGQAEGTAASEPEAPGPTASS